MDRLRAFGQFWYDFVIGDDWRLAAGALVALALAGLVAHAEHSAWWIVPFVVAVLLSISVLRATPRRS
jgi:hypothetical protein